MQGPATGGCLTIQRQELQGQCHGCKVKHQRTKNVQDSQGQGHGYNVKGYRTKIHSMHVHIYPLGVVDKHKLAKLASIP